jgi:hypothetical protein
MPAREQHKKQGSQYDKIIKENLDDTLPIIIREVLGLEIRESEELPDDVQHTKERKPDGLKKVRDAAGNTYVLQVEFQLKDEKEMIYRMGEYYFMLMRRYKLPIKQFVIYLGDNHPKMPTSLETANLKFDFTLTRIAEASYKLFLKSNNPKVMMLGILANFGKESSYQVIKAIVERIESKVKSDLDRGRYFKQLRIFLQLRSHVEQEFDKVMESVSTFFKEENDIYYRKGQAKGADKERHKFVRYLIIKLGMTDAEAAQEAEADLSFVAKVRAELDNK